MADTEEHKVCTEEEISSSILRLEDGDILVIKCSSGVSSEDIALMTQRMQLLVDWLAGKGKGVSILVLDDSIDIYKPLPNNVLLGGLLNGTEAVQPTDT